MPLSIKTSLAVVLTTERNHKDYFYCGKDGKGKRVWSLNRFNAYLFLRGGIADYAQAIKYRDRMYAEGFKEIISVLWMQT